MNDTLIKQITSHTDDHIKGFFEDYHFLSNFTLCRVYYDGHIFPSLENAYQFAKIDMFEIENFEERDNIRKQFQACSPATAKKLTKKNMPIRKEWEQIKLDVMAHLLYSKFYRNLTLRKKLLETGDKYLEETNYWGDTFWGVCKGEGSNYLGKFLMVQREYWKNQNRACWLVVC